MKMVMLLMYVYCSWLDVFVLLPLPAGEVKEIGNLMLEEAMPNWRVNEGYLEIHYLCR